MENVLETIVGWVTGVFGENPSWDILLLVVTVGLVLALAFWGRSKIMMVIVASYMSVVLLSVTHLALWLQDMLAMPSNIWWPVGIVIAVTGVMFAIVQYSLGSLLKSKKGPLANAVILAISVVGMLSAFMFTMLPSELLLGFSPITLTVLVGDIAFVVWALAPMLMIGLTED